MNTEKLCIGLEKIFGKYKSKCMKKDQRVLSGNKTMMSSPYSNFLYEVNLYGKSVFQSLRSCLVMTEYLYSLCDKVDKQFRRRFRKNYRKSCLAT